MVTAVNNKPMVLLYDPVYINNKLTSKILEKEKFTSFIAKSNDDIHNLIKKHPGIRLLIVNLETVLDIQTNESTGFIEELRTLHPNVHILIVTASKNQKRIMALFQLGIKVFVSKPFQKDHFIKTVKHLTSKNANYMDVCDDLKIFDNFPNPMYMVNAKSEIIYSNREFNSLFQFRAKDLRDRPICCTTLKFNECREDCVCTIPLTSKKIYKVRELKTKITGTDLNLYASFIPLTHINDPIGVLVSLNDLTAEANLQSNFKELYELEKEKTIQLSKATEKLEDLNKNLESKVEQRTAELQQSRQEIKEVLDNIDLAIITFDEQGQLSQGHSQACNHVFNKELSENMTIYQALEMDDASNEYEELSNWIKMCFQVYGKLDWPDLYPLCPFKEWSFNDKIIQTEWNPVAIDNVLHRIMMISRDITEEVKLKERIKVERQQHEDEVSVMMGLISCNENELQLFLKEMIERIHSLKQWIEEGFPKESLNAVCRAAHSIKGGAGLMKFKRMAEISHHFEDHVLRIQAAKVDEKDDSEKLLKDHFQQLVTEHELIIKWATHLNLYHPDSETRFVKVNETEVLSLLKLLKTQRQKIKDKDERAKLDLAFDRWKDKFTVSCFEYFSKFSDMIQSIADKQLKRISPLEIHGGDTRVDPKYISTWTDPLTHILRNAIDHGIENEEERKQLNKPKEAKIKLHFEIKDGEFQVRITDDGRGIDGEKVYQKVLDKGLTTKDSYEDNEKQLLIFTPGISTADHVTEISGRGVGMDIVKQMIEDIGGGIELQSTLGQGTEFILRAPYQDPIID